MLRKAGFTIIELVIVIAIIGILASVSIVTYNGSQSRGEFARAQTDMKHINDAIIIYRSQVGTYPAGSASFVAAPTALTTALVTGKYLDSAAVLTAKTDYTYLYRADAAGLNYKLLRTINSGTLPSSETSANSLLNTSGTSANNSWGYWSTGGASW